MYFFKQKNLLQFKISLLQMLINLPLSGHFNLLNIIKYIYKNCEEKKSNKPLFLKSLLSDWQLFDTYIDKYKKLSSFKLLYIMNSERDVT